MGTAVETESLIREKTVLIVQKILVVIVEGVATGKRLFANHVAGMAKEIQEKIVLHVLWMLSAPEADVVIQQMDLVQMIRQYADARVTKHVDQVIVAVVANAVLVVVMVE